MKTDEQIYLRNIMSRWKTELDTDERVYILSPHITAITAKEIFENSNTYYFEIYTSFDLVNFLNRNSSITALKTLVKKGFEAYFLPNLQANIILVSNKFVSVGSQSLTNQGTDRKQATFASADLEIVKYVENELKKNWLGDGKKITLEMLADVETKLKPLKSIYKMLESELESVLILVEENSKQKDNESFERRAENTKRKERLEANIENLTKIAIGKGEVREKGNHKTFVREGHTDYSIINRNSEIPIKKSHYHLAVVEETGRLAWARPMVKSITFFRNNLTLSFPAKLNQEEYSVSFIANSSMGMFSWSDSPLTNLEMKLSSPKFEYPVCTISIWFDLMRLEIVKVNTIERDSLKIVESKVGSRFVNSVKGIETWIQENGEEFESIIINSVLTPFKLEKNLLDAPDAEYFLNGSYGKYELKLSKIEDKPILIFRELKYGI